MAMQATNGGYLRIRKIELVRDDASAIRYEIFPSKQARESGLGNFQRSIEGSARGLDVTAALSTALEPGKSGGGKSRADEMIAGAYGHLKKLDEFKDWADA